jgi:sec-independent protein translocase protein TatB
VFNIQGSELIFLLLIALVVLGPEKLPEAMKKFGRAYSEFKKLSNGFQGEFRSVLEEPMRELRDTAEAMRQAVNFDESPASSTATPTATPAATPAPAAAPASGLNFGSMQRNADPEPAAPASSGPAETAAAADGSATGGLNFGRMQRDEGSAE